MSSINIAIEYDSINKQFNVYEPTTDTLLLSENLTEGLVLLNEFLIKNGFIDTDILKNESIKYHLDSHTMKAMIDSNVKLIKRLSRAPSEFQMAQDKFGTTNSSTNKKFSSFGQNNTSGIKTDNPKVTNFSNDNPLKYNRSDSGFSGFGKGFKTKNKSKFN